MFTDTAHTAIRTAIDTKLYQQQSDLPFTVLIDGRSGAGKTTLAAHIMQLFCKDDTLIAAGVQEEACQLIHMDDLYPGWFGLEKACNIVADHVLSTNPDHAHYTTWDWHNNKPGRTIVVSPTRNLIIEGVGALSAESLRAARTRSGERVLTIFVHAESSKRKARALRRDPEFTSWWQVWADQEEKHCARIPQADLWINTN